MTPSVPPQLVACSERRFYRIAQRSLQVFEVSRKIPPPQIRGSAVARQTGEVDIAEPLSVISLGKQAVLVIAKNDLLRYDPDQKRVRRYVPIRTSGPFVAWPDPRNVNSFWVHALGDKTLQRFTLAAPASRDSGSPQELAKVESRAEDLPDFDSRLVTVLANGALLYSTPKGLILQGDESRPAPFPELPGPATVLFTDSAHDRYWAADAAGNLGLWDRKKGKSPLSVTRVPGVMIDAAEQGARVAVLGMQLGGQSYRPSVTIFTNGKQEGQLSVGPSAGSLGQPKLDLCLMAGQPWVVVGGKYWLQLLDWTSPRLLAEWGG